VDYVGADIENVARLVRRSDESSALAGAQAARRTAALSATTTDMAERNSLTPLVRWSRTLIVTVHRIDRFR